MLADDVATLQEDPTVKRVVEAFSGKMTAIISEQELTVTGLGDT